MKTVMLLDDARSIRSLFGEVIRQAGFNTQTASSAEEALLYIVENGFPDLIISDIHMPGIGGMEFCRRVRKLSKQTPIIIMSALSDKELVAQAQKLGIQNWLLKPVEPGYFLNRLTAILGETQALST
ncbi:response regulator transcription factor [Limnobacter parvus]|uniref:Response regulator n=1 Tax=Limnobacter parvus TaxID=2939690 RepID=A0ABT1XF12_9BURK|nr:response regulator [Limnobacter parvus]MCR2745188.1 response regulator [Limnobacter parvus]